jgi:hypothetical protein
MGDVERLLGVSTVRVAIEDPTTPDAKWCIEQYFSELRAGCVWLDGFVKLWG